MNIFDSNYKRPDVCVKADPNSQFCQLLGEYRMTLPQYNTFKPFPHVKIKNNINPIILNFYSILKKQIR